MVRIGALWLGIKSIYAFFSVTPFITFFLIWFIAHYVWKDRKRATHLAMDVTTLLLITSVAVMYDLVFPGSAINGIWIVLAFVILLAGFMGNMQTRLKGKVNPQRLFKGVWRISFMVLSFWFVLFLLIGIAKKI